METDATEMTAANRIEAINLMSIPFKPNVKISNKAVIVWVNAHILK